jgi:hypothetical protein
MLEETPIQTEKSIAEDTLKRLHTLGIQKFGSSPFSEHFDRWLTNLEAVLSEFESYPSIAIDDQYIRERTQTLEVIKLQLENNRRREATLEQQTKNLSIWRNHLKQINTEYAAQSSTFRARKRGHLRRLYKAIDTLKKEQQTIIELKTGIFHGLSKKAKEQREIEVSQKLNDQQRELELAILEYNVAQKQVRDQFEQKREPVLEQIKFFRKAVADLEEDASLEDRWFACEALIDAVNGFLQRKAQPSGGPAKSPL